MFEVALVGGVSYWIGIAAGSVDFACDFHQRMGD
jgi:hypothetical protein